MHLFINLWVIASDSLILQQTIYMSELAKFINLLIEFQEKVEGHLNKKYKTFMRKVANLQTLAKNVDQNRVLLTKEIIIFKLGLEAKSHKAVEVSLNYLHKLFQLKMIDLNLPDYCECYSIEESGVKEVEGAVPKGEIRHQLISLMRHCLHYKSPDINQLLIKILQFLITEPILDLILDAAVEHPHDSVSQLLNNYFAFRFHVYEEICSYTEAQIKSFPTLTLHSQKIEKQIKRAHEEETLLKDLISRYMIEYLSIIDGTGGRYGQCVMCSQPAEHYCKVTKASLCGMDCKKKHIEMAEKQYKHHFQSSHLWDSILTSFEDLLVFLSSHDSSTVFSVLPSLLEKPFLFMVVKSPFRKLLERHVPGILTRILKYKSEASFDSIYFFMAYLTKYWLFECLSPIEYFLKEYIVKVLEDKKPSYRFLNLVFKSLARILEHGKVTVQLYVNFDCEVNKQNLLENVLFQLAKIVQDKYAQTSSLSKQERHSVKNHSLSLLIIMVMGLKEYRKSQIKSTSTEQIRLLKQKKTSLEQFVVRFNEHWTNGLKTLFNLNLVGLDSNQEIVDIFLNLKGLSKYNLEQYFACDKGQELYQIFLQKIVQKYPHSLFLTLIDLFHYIPLKHSPSLKKFTECYQRKYKVNIDQQVQVYLKFLISSYSQQEFRSFIEQKQEEEEIPQDLNKLWIYSLETKQLVTAGNHTTFFTYCCSRDYLDVLANQIALLQIPLSYLLENDYEVERLLSLTEELIEVCPHSNWLSLLVKNSAIERYPSPEFDQCKFKIVMGVLNIMEKQAHFVQNWSTVIYFIAQLHSILKKRPSNEGKVNLADKLNIGIVQRCIMEAGIKVDQYFGKFLLAVLAVGREQIEKDSLFMVHKFFQIIDMNSKKFLTVIHDFMPHLLGFTKHLENAAPQVCISVADMLKQSFAKLLKVPKDRGEWQAVEADFWQLFLNLSNNRSKEVSDFVVNCITMSVLNHYQLSLHSWTTLFRFMKNNLKEYPHQVLTLVQKIIDQEMKNCEDFYRDLITICLDLVHPEQTKNSTEALHSLKNALDITFRIKLQDSDQDQFQTSVHDLSSLLVEVQERLVNFIFYYCHEEILESFFRLLTIKAKQTFLLKQGQVNELIKYLFKKIEKFSPETLQVSEKTIIYALNWSISQKYCLIVSFLQSLVVDKYTALSLSSIKCIKTYIQIVNPKNRQEWQHIESSLLSICRNTRISDLIDLSIENRYKDYQIPINFDDSLLRVNLNLFSNKMVIQKNIIQMLPNHVQCLQQALSLYKEVISINDNLYLRCLLWRRGLGANDNAHPPDLLLLEETLSGKLVGIYFASKKDEDIISFATDIFRRYCETCQELQILCEYQKNVERGETIQEANAELLHSYLTARKVPLMRVINYFLPKFSKVCKTPLLKKQVVLWLVESCKYVDNRELFLKIVRDLTQK